MLEDGKPGSGIRMTLVSVDSGRSRSTTAGVDGGFVFSDVPPGPYTLLRDAGTSSRAVDEIRIEAKPDSTTRAMRWAKAGRWEFISGRVLDSDGRPLAGVMVSTKITVNKYLLQARAGTD